MNKQHWLIKVLFFITCLVTGLWVVQVHPDIDAMSHTGVLWGGVMGLLLIAGFDYLIKKSLAKYFGAVIISIILGSLLTWAVSASPLLERFDAELLYLTRLAIFVVSTYAFMVVLISRGDQFSLLIPFVRLFPEYKHQPCLIVDLTTLIDGRIASLCQSRFITNTIIVPKFVLDELRKMTENADPHKQAKAKRGLEVFNRLKSMHYIDMRVESFFIQAGAQQEAALVNIAQKMKAKLLTADHNLAKLADFQGVQWLNLSTLTKMVNPDVSIGQLLEISLVKVGQDKHQGVGYLADGSMVVVNESADYVGQMVTAEVINILPTSGGKMVFAKLQSTPTHEEMLKESA